MSTFLDIFRWSRSGKGTDRGPANTGPRPPLTCDERRDLDAARQLAAAINHAPTGTGPR